MSAEVRTFLDTNVLVYLFDTSAPAKQATAQAILGAEDAEATLVISTQVLQEFYVTVTRKLAKPLSPEEAEEAVRNLAGLSVVEIDVALVLEAIGRSRKSKISLWDALIVESALADGCERLLSEDLQHGQEFRPLRIENPFR